MEHSRAHAFATQRRALVHAKHITRGTFENPIADAQSELALQDGNLFVVEHSPGNRTIVILRNACPHGTADHRRNRPSPSPGQMCKHSPIRHFKASPEIIRLML